MIVNFMIRHSWNLNSYLENINYAVQGVENDYLAVPVNNTLVYRMSFLAAES